MKDLKERSICTFKDHCELGSFTIKFHVVNHICEDLEKFEIVRFLGASAYGHFNVVLYRAYFRTSVRRASRTKEMSGALESTDMGMNGKKR